MACTKDTAEAGYEESADPDLGRGAQAAADRHLSLKKVERIA
jgi:hypothetical protein